MTDQRSSFRFRMPRLRPASVPPPRPTTATTQTPARRSAIQPQPEPSTPPVAPIRPQAAAPALPPALPVIPSIAPAPAPQAPAAAPPILPPAVLPVRPRGTVPASTPEPPVKPSTAAAPVPPPPASQDEPASMPTPAQATQSSPADSPLTKPAIAEAPESRKTESQPSSPSQTGIQSRVSSHSASASRMSTQPHGSAKPPSPSTRSQPMSQPSSPARVQQSQPASPLTSPSRLASQPEKKISSLPPSPIVATPQVQQKEVLFSQPTQPNQSPSSGSVADTARVNSSAKFSGNQLKTEDTPEVKRLVETNPAIASDNSQKDADLALNVTHDAINEVEGEIKTTETNEEIHQETFMEQSSEQSNAEAHIKEQPRIETPKSKEKQHEKQEAISTTSKIHRTLQTNSIILHPADKVPVPESPQKPKPINKEQTSEHEETMGKVSTFVNKRATSPPKQFLNEKPVSVITLAGDNRGTSMRIGSGANKRERAIHIYRRYKVNPDESADTTTDGEGSSKGKKSEKDLKATDDLERNAFINCNIQGINNSMVFNSSFAERNPGVHLGSSCDRENVNKPKRKNTKSMDMNKVEANITPSQKLTYEPMIRRRCLRGLFMESSDSDPDDPQKPRRHGCRYICQEKGNKDDKTNAL